MIFPTIKRIFLLMITVFAGNTLLFADPPAPEENPGTEGEVVHVLGDQAFSFSLGGLIPLFHYRFSTENFETTNLFPGAKGTLQYFTYLTNTITVGVELSGGLAFTPNFNIYWFLPLMAKATYRLPIGNFEIPLSLAVGVNFQKYLDWSRADLIIKPEAGFAFRIDPDFTLCFSVGWWL
ncbi:MAG: hypothetical protein EHM28_07925, partial [Spirochaetaceae bacterium]